MLKISLESSQASVALVNILRELLRSDRAFVAGNVNKATDIHAFCPSDNRQIEVHYILGEDITGSPFCALLLSHAKKSLDSSCVLRYSTSPGFLERPFVFSSTEEAKQIWPHLTLEDRVIDATLFALSGYIIPRKITLIRQL